MKRILLILLIATFIGCDKDDNSNNNSSVPVTFVDENVEQYIGLWSFVSKDCTDRQIKISEGQGRDQLIFDNISGTVKNKRLNASSPVATWIVSFSSSSLATVDYNGGTCTGTLTKL